MCAFYRFANLVFHENNSLILGLNLCSSTSTDFPEYVEIEIPESYFYLPLDLYRSYIVFNPDHPSFDDLFVLCDLEKNPVKF